MGGRQSRTKCVLICSSILSLKVRLTPPSSSVCVCRLPSSVRLAWVIVGLFCWNQDSGVVSRVVDKEIRAVFFGLDYFQAAAAFTLFTILARFWAELACAARQGSVQSPGDYR